MAFSSLFHVGGSADKSHQGLAPSTVALASCPRSCQRVVPVAECAEHVVESVPDPDGVEATGQQVEHQRHHLQPHELVRLARDEEKGQQQQQHTTEEQAAAQ